MKYKHQQLQQYKQYENIDDNNTLATQHNEEMTHTNEDEIYNNEMVVKMRKK